MKKIISKSIFLTIIVMGINFGFKVYLSYCIGKGKIGIFYTILDFVSIFVLFFTGYKDSIIKVFADGKFLLIFRYITRNYIIMTLIASLLLYLMYTLQLNVNKLVDVHYVVIYFFVIQISNFYSYLNAAYRNYNSMLYEKSVKALSLVISFLMLSFFFDSITSLIISYIVQSIMHIIYIYITSNEIFSMPKKTLNIKLYKQFLKNYFFSTFTSLFGSITIYISAIIMLYLYNNNNTLSEYQVVAKSVFFALITIFVHPVAAYTFPQISKFIVEKNYTEVVRIDGLLKKYLIVMIGLIMISMFFTKWSIAFIFPVEYVDSYKMLNIMLPTLPFIVYTSFSLNILKALNRFDMALIIRVIGLISFIFSTLIFYYILKVGSINIVYSLDFSFICMFLASIYLKNKFMK